MRGPDSEQLREGACIDLAPEVVDKYFMADATRERFEAMTAKAMCGQCAVRGACLEDAIVEPPGYGIRGGETASALWRLHARWMDEHVDADVLAEEAIRRQGPLGGITRARSIHAGLFKTVELAFPEMGGAA